MKHTPGPWTVHEAETYGVKGFEIHWSDDGECITDHVYEEADANLIGASPEMFEALEGLIQQMKRADELYDRGECDSQEFDDAVQALAKAKGITK